MFVNTRIGGLLHNEHMQTLSALQGLEEFLLRQTSRRPPDVSQPAVRDLLGRLVATLAAEVERHFGFEENHLFPLLTSRGEPGMAAFLAEEHATILPLALGLVKNAQAALQGDGFDEAGWKSFHRRGMELCEREMLHIQKEEMGLLMAIGAYVDAEADAALAEAYGHAQA